MLGGLRRAGREVRQTHRARRLREHRAEYQQQSDGEQHPVVDRTSGAKGFCTKCAVASADDSVMVMIQEVATKPSRVSTNSLPHQNGSSRSSMATDP